MASDCNTTSTKNQRSKNYWNNRQNDSKMRSDFTSKSTLQTSFRDLKSGEISPLSFLNDINIFLIIHSKNLHENSIIQWLVVKNKIFKIILKILHDSVNMLSMTQNFHKITEWKETITEAVGLTNRIVTAWQDKGMYYSNIFLNMTKNKFFEILVYLLSFEDQPINVIQQILVALTNLSIDNRQIVKMIFSHNITIESTEF